MIFQDWNQKIKNFSGKQGSANSRLDSPRYRRYRSLKNILQLVVFNGILQRHDVLVIVEILNVLRQELRENSFLQQKFSMEDNVGDYRA